MEKEKREFTDRHDDGRRSDRRRPQERGPRMDDKVRQAIDAAMEHLQDSLTPYEIHDLNGFQRKQIHRFFERKQEYAVKTYRNEEIFVMKVFPVGRLRRLAEQRAQEVLMKAETIALPPMGSYERFVVHSYLKDRGGVNTESSGDGADRHIEISPVFGRTLKKAKRRLT